MSNTNKKLFSDFEPVSKEKWMERVTADLKGADFDKKLVWKNLNKINIQPFYNTEDHKEYLKNTGENSPSLVNYRSIYVSSEKRGNALALAAIKEGHNGILFIVKGNMSPSRLLRDIDLNTITISFTIKKNAATFVQHFKSFIKSSKVDKKNLTGFVDTQLISKYVTKGEFGKKAFTEAAEVFSLVAKYPNYKALTISASEYLDSGANQVQEIAYALNSLVFVIDKLSEKGITPQEVFENVNFRFAIGLEYFIEIGKFRAFNNLLHEIAKKYQVTAFKHTVLAKTSIWSKSITDAHTNLLRATTESMSAILGNVDGVLVDPYDKEFNEASDFSSRIAGNITTILQEESYFGKVANPVDGSYYIEEATLAIAEKALQLFQSIESEGGFFSNFEKEKIQEQIAEIRVHKLKLISQRRLPMVGINKYPNLMEKVSSELLSSGNTEGNSKTLKPRRASLEIEAMRKKTEELVEQTKVRPVVELASFGNLTMRKARAAFAYDFVGVSGYNVQQEKSYESAEEAAEISAKSNSHVVVLCSSDQDYEEKAVSFVQAFRILNKDKVLLIAGNPTGELLSELTKAGLDGCVNLRSDVLITIASIQNKIQKTLNPLAV
ncbi:methylmalonyl-CoA mutase family protein [uncultured Maribacter sp.]|uniref:methylmalonyl-CoA mutase family protein n=1 Tax=uncultured Maribacter sp. TaxID=431308 RepID=UPI0026206332|nr:methylmalonyl-CoA mutase family protein [uncultured Maribacter sp.]